MKGIKEMKKRETIWQRAYELEQQGKAFCLVMVTASSGSVPRGSGAAMLVSSDGVTVGTIGGGNVERLCTQEALKVIAEGKPVTESYCLDDIEGTETGSICGGSFTIVFFPNPAKRVAHIFGAGHVARPTAHLAALAGYSVIIYDNNPEFANATFFPDASKIVIGDAVTQARELKLKPEDVVIILSASHETDLQVLKTFKDRLPLYLGIIASRKKALHFRQALEVEGWSAADIEAIHTPIGLSIGARTPEEIAVSIVGQLIATCGSMESPSK